MKVYFLSAIPCALTLNGNYFGITDGFERFAEISLKDNLYAQFSPENALPIGCFLTEQLRFSPPEGFAVYLLPDGLALYARDFPPRDFHLKTLDQKREGDTLATLFLQGDLTLSIERAGNLVLVHPPRDFANAKIEYFGRFIGLEKADKLALYTVEGKCVFCENVRSFSVTEDTLTACLPLSDALGREAECIYRFTDNDCARTNITLRQARAETGATETDEIQKSLLPFAFFESVLLGLDFAHMLSDELAQKSEDLRSFLGDFIAVVPTRAPCTCGLVKQKGERLYDVRHFTVDVENGKITDIRG